MSDATRTDRRCGQRGAALLTAMIIVALVATLAGSMVWQQWRAIQVEAAERARAQSAWLLSGAVDWVRLIILREDWKDDKAKGTMVDHLGEPWAVPLAEARLSTFLAADKDNNTEDAPDAFLSGDITDAMARYNLVNLIIAADDKAAKDYAQVETEGLLRLCETVGVSADVAMRIVTSLRAAAPAPPSSSTSSPAPAPTDTPLMPRSASQVAWLGIDPETLRALTPYIVIIPESLGKPGMAQVNVNTASREVLVAATGIDPGTAESIIQARQRAPFKTVAALKAFAPKIDAKVIPHLAVNSNFFDVRARIRLGDIVLEQRSLVQRRSDGQVVVLQRERVSSRERAGS